MIRRLAIVAVATLGLAACVGTPPGPNAFIAPDDCFDLSKHDHPAYVDACGNEQ